MKHNVATILSETREILYNFLSQTSRYTTTRHFPFYPSIEDVASISIFIYLIVTHEVHI